MPGRCVFAGIGPHGQERLAQAHIAVVGCGALGCFQAGALARAGVGHLTVVDRDYVELSNLQRQWLFDEQDAAEGMPKAAAAVRAIRRINSGIEIQGVVADLTPSNISELLAGADLILDGTDNFETRYLINDFAVSRTKPWIYGAAVGSYGLTMPVVPEQTACLACVYPEAPAGVQPTCETAGVLNVLTSTVASLQTAAVLKMVVDGVEAVAPLITTVDLWDGRIRQVSMPARDPQCRACGQRDFTHLEGERRPPISLCGRNAVQIHERSRPLDLGELRRSLEPLGEVRANEFALRFFVPPYELTIFPDGRAIIKGTQDVGVARSLYAKYVGN